MKDDVDLPVDIRNYGLEKTKYFWSKLMSRLLFDVHLREETKGFILLKTEKFMFLKTNGKYKNSEVKDDIRRYIPYKELENISQEIDGNPIYLCHIPHIRRSIRIIQESPTEDKLEIGAWVETANEYQIFDELVISLELSEESYSIVKALIYYWLFQSEENRDMNNFINWLFFAPYSFDL